MAKPKLTKTREDILLGKLQAMSEAEFTELSLIPLFKSMGYKVDYHGGPAEGGKDLICRKGGDFGFDEISVVQVKKTTASAAAGKSNSFSGIVTQLQQAVEKKVPSLSGISQLPSHVYFITPYEIDTRTLESRFEGFASLAPRGVRILDGRAVVNALVRLLPELAEQLCGQSFAIETRLLANISNADLLSALNYSNEKRISDFYCDLDFGVGKINTKNLFATEFCPSILQYSIPQSRWVSFENIASELECFSVDKAIAPAIERVKELYEVEHQKWMSPANQEIIKSVSRLRGSVEKAIEDFLEKAAQVVSEALTEELPFNSLHQDKIKKSGNELTEDQSRRLRKIRDLNSKLYEQFEALQSDNVLSVEVFNRIGGLIDSCDEHNNDILAEIAILKATAKARLAVLVKEVSLLRATYKKLGVQLAKRVVEPNYELELNGEYIVFAIEREKKWISDAIEKLSSKKLEATAIRDFFIRCQNFFKLLERLFTDKYFSAVVEPKISMGGPIDAAQRISMPLREVFATGIHCAVFGEAGAGKSTTLHQYAAFASACNAENELTLFLPLTRILTEKLLPANASSMAPVQILENCLGQFLSSEKSYSSRDIIEFIKAKRRVTFIFDGVDEVIKRTPWIVEAINDIERIYGNSQIILSSRMSGSYVDSIQYLGLTLLPFTDEQVSHFVDGWFATSPHIAQLVRAHLKSSSELQQIVRSPLLATILCVLAENSVPLPEGELSMYAERFKLLFGHYDIHKKTRRIESHHTLLETIARKLAYYLHTRNIRSASAKDLEVAALRIMGKRGKANELNVRKAVQELIDPCNILVPMTADGDFGFGHLRYQEYLSAAELVANRGIDLAPLLAAPWWRSVLVLFSKMTDEIAYIIEDMLYKGLNVTKCHENLMAMIVTRKKDEQKQLKQIIDGHRELDKWDEALHDYDDRDDSVELREILYR